MEDAIASRVHGQKVQLDYLFESNELVFRDDTSKQVPFDYLNDPGIANSEILVAVYWEAKSNTSNPGWEEAVGDGLYGVLRRYNLADTSNSRPLDFIGHSFGTVVNSEAIERLGSDGINVDQMTTLDPHDWDQAGIPVDGGALTPDVHVWSNVHYADNYYETEGGDLCPHGRPVAGARNSDLTPLEGFYDGLFYNPHSRTHDYYQGTIDGASGMDSWYPLGTAASRTARGFYYSRLGRASPAERDAYFLQIPNDQRTDVHAALSAAALSDYGFAQGRPGEDISGPDPAPRFFNGDFEIGPVDALTLQLAGYADGDVGNPYLAVDPSSPLKTKAADLTADPNKTFEHRPVYFPRDASGFSFTYDTIKEDANSTLTITFSPDDRPSSLPFQTDASWVLRSKTPGPVTLTLDQTNFPDFPQLRGRLVSIRFALDGGFFPGRTLIDNLDIKVPARTAQAEVETVPEATPVVDNQPQAVSLGSKPLGQGWLDKTFKVANRGSSTLTTSSLQVPAGFVVIDGLAASLAPATSDTFTVRMVGTEAKVYSGQVSFTSNDPAQPVFSFPISGTYTTVAASKPDLALETIDGPNAGVLARISR